MEIHRFIYKSDKSGFLSVMAYVFFIIGTTMIKSNTTTAVGLYIAGIALLLYQSGIELDLRDGSYRFITTFSIIHIGKWDYLPPLKTISVFAVNKSTRLTSIANNVSIHKDNVVQVNLITENNQKIKILETTSSDAAFALAKAVAHKFDMSIWDATGRSGKWVEF
jgi:hypothetical protein